MAIAIGVFDGVHLGHKDIFTSLVKGAKRDKTESMVITFSKNPKKKVHSLDSMRLREDYVESFGINYFTIIDFSEDFSKISGSEFIRLLRTICRVKRVVVGEDFKCGNPSSQITAGELGEEFHKQGSPVRVIIRPAVLDGKGRRISSTMLREMISRGRLSAAEKLSTRFYQIDLSTLDSKVESDNLIVDTTALEQQLPPKGKYMGVLRLKGGYASVDSFLIEDGYLFFPGVSRMPDTLSILTKE